MLTDRSTKIPGVLAIGQRNNQRLIRTYMERTIFQQIIEQFDKAGKILIALPAKLTTDNTASALGLMLFLKKLNKEVDIVSAGVLPGNLSFLPGITTIKNSPHNNKSFVVSLNTAKAPLDEISYEAKEGKLDIFIKAKEGQYAAEDVSFSSSQPHYHTLVILDCASLENVGALFENNADLFFNIPKINIDNKASNEYFGAINFVDINSTSIAEMLSGLFAAYEQQLVDEDIATCLLAGIITKTNSFQHVQTTPHAFMKASELIALGGRQQEVVRHLYKTKPLHLLRLWGRALARLKIANNGTVLYSLLSRADFEKAQSSEEDLFLVLKEMLDNTSSYKIICLLSEQQDGGVNCLVAVHPQITKEALSQGFGIPLTQLANPLGAYIPFELVLKNTSLVQAEEKFAGVVSELLKETNPA